MSIKRIIEVHARVGTPDFKNSTKRLCNNHHYLVVVSPMVRKVCFQFIRIWVAQCRFHLKIPISTALVKLLDDVGAVGVDTFKS